MREKGKLHDFNTYMHDTVTETGYGEHVLTQRWIKFKFIRERDGKEFNVERPLEFENNKEDLRLIYAIEDLVYADIDKERK